MLTCMPSEDSALLGRNVLRLLLSARRRESGSRLPIGSGLIGERCGACVREGVMVLESSQGDARRDGGEGLLPNATRFKISGRYNCILRPCHSTGGGTEEEASIVKTVSARSLRLSFAQRLQVHAHHLK